MGKHLEKSLCVYYLLNDWVAVRLSVCQRNVAWPIFIALVTKDIFIIAAAQFIFNTTCFILNILLLLVWPTHSALL